MRRALMPETAVHEDRQLELGEDEVRFAENALMPAPAVMRSLRKTTAPDRSIGSK